MPGTATGGEGRPRSRSGEFAAIERLRARLGVPPPDEVWVGDDAAVLHPPPPRALLAIDAVVAGVHADLGLVGLDDFGWKALAVNLSDIAAMGGRPLHAVVSVTGPPDTDLDLLYDGIVEAATAYRTPVVGGDLSTGPSLVVAVAVTGTTDGRPPVLRSGARPGDVVVVTGRLGASAAGLAHLRVSGPGGVPVPGAVSVPGAVPGPGGVSGPGAVPGPGGVSGPGGVPVPGAVPVPGSLEPASVRAHRRPLPRLREGRLAALAGATAMLDISDGFGADVDHLASASGVGLELDDLPVAPGANEEQAWAGGEDYELVFAIEDPAPVTAAFTRAGLPAPLVVGRCTDRVGDRLLRGRPWVPAGWEHPWS